MDMVQHQSFRPPNPKQITNLTNHTPEYPDYYVVPKPKGNDELHLLPTIIGVQGVVLCKSGSNYFPIQGNFFLDATPTMFYLQHF